MNYATTGVGAIGGGLTALAANNYLFNNDSLKSKLVSFALGSLLGGGLGYVVGDIRDKKDKEEERKEEEDKKNPQGLTKEQQKEAKKYLTSGQSAEERTEVIQSLNENIPEAKANEIAKALTYDKEVSSKLPLAIAASVGTPFGVGGYILSRPFAQSIWGKYPKEAPFSEWIDFEARDKNGEKIMIQKPVMRNGHPVMKNGVAVTEEVPKLRHVKAGSLRTGFRQVARVGSPIATALLSALAFGYPTYHIANEKINSGVAAREQAIANGNF